MPTAFLAKACTVMGIDGLLIETHPSPKNAKSDASQQLNYDQFTKLHQELKPVASVIDHKIV